MGAGAWTPAQGSAYNKLALNYFYSDRYFGPTPTGFEDFTNLNLTYYGEYGLLDALTVFGSIPLQRLTQTQNGRTIDTYGVGDTDLGLRYRVLAEPFVLSGQFIFKMPYFYDANDSLPLGNGQEDFDFRVLAGKSFGLFGYGGVEAAYRYRVGPPADEFRYLVEYGLDVTAALYGRIKLDGIAGLNNGEDSVDVSGNPTLANQFDLGKLEFTGGYKLTDRWWTEFTVTPNLYGSNTLRGVNFQFAAVYVF